MKAYKHKNQDTAQNCTKVLWATSETETDLGENWEETTETERQIESKPGITHLYTQNGVRYYGKL